MVLFFGAGTVFSEEQVDQTTYIHSNEVTQQEIIEQKFLF
jgi:hypothetical protein